MDLISPAKPLSSRPRAAALGAVWRRRLRVRVAISGRTRASLEMVAETLASRAGGRLAIVVGDVGAKGGPAQIAAEAAAALGGRINILVNNAGGARPIAGEADDAYWALDEVLPNAPSVSRRDLIAPTAHYVGVISAKRIPLRKLQGSVSAPGA